MLLATLQAAEPSKPNILFIAFDDLRPFGPFMNGPVPPVFASIGDCPAGIS